MCVTLRSSVYTALSYVTSGSIRSSPLTRKRLIDRKMLQLHIRLLFMFLHLISFASHFLSGGVEANSQTTSEELLIPNDVSKPLTEKLTRRKGWTLLKKLSTAVLALTAMLCPLLDAGETVKPKHNQSTNRRDHMRL